MLYVIKNGINCEQNKIPVGEKITRIETIAKKRFDFERVGYANLTESEKERSQLKVGDILFSHINSPIHVGKTAIYEGEEDIYHGINLLLMRTNEDVNPNFFNHFLNHLFVTGYWEANCKKSVNQASVNQKDISKVEFNYPPLSTQQKIVAKLDAIFAEIDKASTAAEANTENAKLYLGKIIDEVIHERLEKYKELTLNDITEVITCGVAKRPEYVESGIPFLSARNVKNGKMKWDRYEFVSEETHNTLSKYNKPKVGDILYSRVGAGFGDAAIIDKDIEFSIFVSLTLLKVKPVVLNEFLCYYLNSPFIKEVARKNITGTGVGNLNVGAVRLFNIKLPDLKTQNEIVKKLDSISQNGRILIDSYFKKLENLSLVKKSILKQAFNGELVKE